MNRLPLMHSPPPLPQPPRDCLVLYDGTCPWCRSWVARMARRDLHQKFAFAPLSGPTARPYLRIDSGAEYHPDDTRMPGGDCMILVMQGESAPQLFNQADAVFHIARRLGGLWSMIALLDWLPTPLSSLGYRLLAAVRHRLPGSQHCPTLPDSALLLP